MLKKTVKRVSILMIIVIIVGVIMAIPTIYDGYRMYQEAVTDMSVADKVELIKRDEDYVPLGAMSEYFKESIVKSEDKRFWYHFGIDPLAIFRAIYNDIKAGSFVEGGSTISQQLAKNMYFDFDKNFQRKIAEVFVAFVIEWNYSKDEILELYCNFIYYGEGCYGIKEAAAHYYGLTPNEMEKQQADDLVYTIKSPNYYNPNEKA